MKYDTVIFDLDGTLLNTIEDLTDSVNSVLNKNSYEKRTIDEVLEFIGNGVKQLMTLSLPKGTDIKLIEKCVTEFQSHYSGNMKNKTKPFPGILELLKELKEKNIKIAIVSNKFDSAVKDLNRHYFSDYIKTAVGETKDIPKKPAPDIVFKALEELGSDLAKSLYVGDSDVDVKTAKNAGLDCAAVTWGFRSRVVLEKENPEYIIDKPFDLLNICFGK